MLRLDPKQAVLEHVAGTTGHAGVADFPSGAASPTQAAKPLSPIVIAGVAQAVETLMLAGLGLFIFIAYLGGEQAGFYVPLVVAASLLANVLQNLGQSHRIVVYRTRLRQIGRALAAWSVLFIALAVGSFLFKASDMVSRVWLVGWFLSGSAALIVFRLGLRALVRRWTAEGRLKRRTVIVGGGKEAEALIEAIRRSADSDVQLFGLFDDREDARSPEMVAGCPKLGRVADLVDYARSTRIDLVIVSMPLSAEKRVLQMLKKLWVLPVDIRLSAHMSQLRFTSKAYSYLGEVPVFDVVDRPISDWNLVFKWLFDRIVALFALIVLSPLMLTVAIAIKLDSKGPVLFRQKRHGFNNELIEVFKFRSMYVDRTDATAARLVTRDDPRVTRVGRFIRKTSIDELPQLFNVLKGELSIVGPRPHALAAKAANKLYHEAVDGYFARHKVKPGITGWAQIHGWRGETDTVEKIMQRVNHDLYYIENWSLLLDLYILAMTPISLLSRSENAY